MPRMIIYGKLFGVCADIDIFFRAELGDSIIEPLHAPNLAMLKCLLAEGLGRML